MADFRSLGGIFLLFAVMGILWMKATFIGAWKIVSPFLTLLPFR